MYILRLLVSIALLGFGPQLAFAQSLPLQALGDDRMPITLQAEHIGPSLWTERPDEQVGQS